MSTELGAVQFGHDPPSPIPYGRARRRHHTGWAMDLVEPIRRNPDTLRGPVVFKNPAQSFAIIGHLPAIGAPGALRAAQKGGSKPPFRTCRSYSYLFASSAPDDTTPLPAWGFVAMPKP